MKKIYIEITNVCNFHCSFCFPATRAKSFMSVEDFRYIAEKVKPLTDYVYLHVLGEPLLHPQLEEILSICNEKGLYVNISTNGSLLAKRKEVLRQYAVRQLNISLHDAEENIAQEHWERFINELLQIGKELSTKTYINFRLWNQNHATSVCFNSLCVSLISKFFCLSENTAFYQKERNVSLTPNIYLQNAPRFTWQIGYAVEEKTCYALKDHVAILANGDVTPCCIDAEGYLLLGNIFKDDLTEILQSKKAVRIKNGFAQHKAVEEYCRNCGFIVGGF